MSSPDSQLGTDERHAPWWRGLCTRGLNLTPRCLTRAEIPDAQRLLYEVYYEEQKWEPLQPNASQLRADHSQRRIVDDLDASAIWVGVFTKGKLVGVTRILERTRMGRLEIERYVDLPASLLADRVVIEANRVAVLAKHRRTLTLAVLHTYCEWMGTRLGALRSIGTATEKIARGPARRYGWLATEVSFRYHPDDPEPVRVLTCPFAWQHRVKVVAGLVRRRFRRRRKAT